jgi:tRNA (adenine57-N1/adenine58-N1)-methyltransferase
MAARRLLVRRRHKEITYYLVDPGQDFHTHLGIIAKKELAKKAGSIVKTTQGEEFLILDASFIDLLQRIKRPAQIMSLKEIGHIIATTGISKASVIVDAGTGSGMLACVLAHLCKKVVTYDTSEEHLALAKKNAAFLGIKNITFKKGDISQKINEKNADLFVLDVPEPWRAVDTAAKALKVGGFLVGYTLQATQLQKLGNALRKDKRFLLLKSCELIERLWKVDGDIVRPQNVPIGHTGFLTFARRIQ